MSDETKQGVTQGRELSPLQQKQLTIRDLLEKAKPKLAEVLPRHLTPERMVKIALAATNRSPQLLQCSPMSVLESVMMASQLGLEPGGALGSAYMVPYKDNGEYKCQLIPGYRGLIDLARRSGQITSIEAHPVYKGEKFRLTFGLNPTLDHEPSLDGTRDPNDIIGVYAIARPKDGPPQWEYMSRSEVEAIKARSKSARSGYSPWTTDYAEMARKTVVRRLCKYLPLSPEMASALDADSRDYSDDMADVIDVTASEERAKSLAAKVRAAKSAPVVDEPLPIPDREPGADDGEGRS